MTAHRAAANAGAVVLLLLNGVMVSAQGKPTLDDVLGRMRSYISEYATQLPATIAEERYEQRVGSGVRYRRRILESEYGIVRVPGDTEWLGFREVLTVDGKHVLDSAQRLEALLAAPSQRALQQAARIAVESARFNIGPLFRTINDPAFVLELLDPRNAHRMRFAKGGETVMESRRTWVVRFEEIASPTIIRTQNGDQPARGRAWVDEENGRVFRVEATIHTGLSTGNIIGVIDVFFERDPRLDFWVPAKMYEKYMSGRNLVTASSGEATYTNYRRFTVHTEENLSEAK